MNRKCPRCLSTNKEHLRYGHFVRRSDSKKLLRFKCKRCLKTFSQATTQSCYWQKKRKLNPRILELLCSGNSQRRIALLLNINRKTVARKLVFLAKQARIQNQRVLKDHNRVERIQFDDLETIEHTKLKPLSITIAVEDKSRFILGARVSQMPAKGLLAKKSRKKYGKRRDDRKLEREKLFKSIQFKVFDYAEITSDEQPHYPNSVKKFFPKAFHKTVKGQRGALTGQGELKKVGFDPLFSLNHTCAMFRDNIKRLARKTWCTTKDKNRLQDVVDLYIYYHNNFLLKKVS